MNQTATAMQAMTDTALRAALAEWSRLADDGLDAGEREYAAAMWAPANAERTARRDAGRWPY